MTNERPSPEAVAEDVPDYQLESLTRLTVDQLAAHRDWLTDQIRSMAREKTAVEAELWRRARDARPEIEESGSAQIAGDTTIVTVGADRDYEYLDRPLIDLQAARDADGQPLLTEDEYNRLVTWIPKVDGRYFNTLLRRGGFLAEALKACRRIRRSNPKIDAKPRS